MDLWITESMIYIGTTLCITKSTYTYVLLDNWNSELLNQACKWILLKIIPQKCEKLLEVCNTKQLIL